MMTVAPFALMRFMTPWIEDWRKLSLLAFMVRRYTPTTISFCRYSFTEEYNKLVKRLDDLDFDIYYINLYMDDTSAFGERLNREGKAQNKYAPFKVESSIKQQET